MLRVETDITRYSGYRLRSLPIDQQVYMREALMQKVKYLEPIAQKILSDHQYCDDVWRSATPMQLLAFNLQNGEIFDCRAYGELGAVCSLHDIQHQRSAFYEGWSEPQFRTFKGRKALVAFARDLFAYAFRPWGDDGLGLKKIKAEVSAENILALKACRALGFKEYGYSPLDSLHRGKPTDMVHLELLNPAYFPPVVGDSLNGQGRRGQSPAGSSLRASSTIHNAAKSRVDRSARPDPDPGDRIGHIGGESVGVKQEPGLELVKPKQPRRRNEPGRARPVRAKLQSVD